MVEQTEKLPVRRLIFLDGLRGLAALYVVIYHARALLYEGFNPGGQFASLPLIEKLPAYFLDVFAYGRQAVMFFFILSGFVIHLRYAERLKRDAKTATFDLLPFLKRRIRRLFPALLFAIVLTTALDAFGRAQNYPIYFGTTRYATLNDVAKEFDYDLASSAGKLVFGSGIQAWGTNSPLWSLRLEWWFYVAYPLFWLLTRRSLRLATGVAIAIFAISLFGGTWFFPFLQRFMGAFISWWLGAVLAEIFVARSRLKLRYVAPLALLLLPLAPAFLLGWTAILPISLHDLLWALAFMGLVALLFMIQEARGSLSLLERFRPLGDFSYTLYATHVPIIVLLCGWLIATSPDSSLPKTPLWIIIGVLISVIIAYIAHFFVERPFTNRRRISETALSENATASTTG